jgi:beta-N-acetylhexosaminidase
MFFGPSLDVIENPYGEGKGDLGVRTFGGDPYWVGELGKEYIRGLHTGSGNRMAVIAKNFPGRGSSDRLPDEEVATVRKSIEQLKLIELAPFFTVTDTKNNPNDALVEGLLLSHIRYQGFQGNIRATTRPVSFDQSAVELLMNLPPLSSWRTRGGILVSDDLGSQAVRKFFSPTGQVFDGRQIARNAFLSGNDLLYMDQLISSNDVDRYQTYKTIIEHFVQKYREDHSFAEKVDAAALRILAIKFRLYPEFKIEQVLTDQRGLDPIGESMETVFAIVSDAASLISPKIDQIGESIPDAPGISDRIIIFTDTFSTAQCSNCPNIEVVPVDVLQRTVLRLYGPSGSGEVSSQNIISYPFEELQDYVDNPFNRPELETNLSRANWVIFLTHDQNPERPGAYALHNFLSRKSEVLRNKMVLLFSLNAPYYYDATEISAFSAYYVLYTKASSAYEVIARIIFKEFVPTGSSPVSIPGVAYNLINATTPDPNQVIELFLDEPSVHSQAEVLPDALNGLTGITDYGLGDNIPIKTGIIVDHNNNPVPDGTIVRFSLNLQGESLTIQQVDATTKEGVARASFKLLSSGLHEIRAVSEPALNSQILILDISEGQGAIISAITPTPIPLTETEEPLLEEEIPEETEIEPRAGKGIRFVEWLGVTAATWISGVFFFSQADFIKQQKKRMTIAGAIVIGGLLSGYWMVFNLPGSFHRTGLPGFLALLAVTFTGSAAGGLAVWFSDQNGSLSKK